MSQTSSAEALEEQATKPRPKVRACLRCSSTFESEWAGERICSSCKRTSAWRKGSPRSSFS